MKMTNVLFVLSIIVKCLTCIVNVLEEIKETEKV